MNTLRPSREYWIVKRLVEGMGIRPASRTTGSHTGTITKVLVRRGRQCRRFLNERMRGLLPEHWELDEIWTFCRKKEKRLTFEEAEAGIWGDQYLFLAVGEETKLVPCFLLGKRDEKNCRRFMVDLAKRLRVCRGERHRISTDGFQPYACEPIPSSCLAGDAAESDDVAKLEYVATIFIQSAWPTEAGSPRITAFATTWERRSLPIQL